MKLVAPIPQIDLLDSPRLPDKLKSNRKAMTEIIPKMSAKRKTYTNFHAKNIT